MRPHEPARLLTLGQKPRFVLLALARFSLCFATLFLEHVGRALLPEHIRPARPLCRMAHEPKARASRCRAIREAHCHLYPFPWQVIPAGDDVEAQALFRARRKISGMKLWAASLRYGMRGNSSCFATGPYLGPNPQGASLAETPPPPPRRGSQRRTLSARPRQRTRRAHPPESPSPSAQSMKPCQLGVGRLATATAAACRAGAITA